MKTWYLLTVIFLCVGATSEAQNKVDKYLILKVNRVKFADENVTVKIDFGSNGSLFSFKDSSIVRDLKMVEKQTTIPDAFNYLGSLGWMYKEELKPVLTNEFLFIFKRVFDTSELK